MGLCYSFLLKNEFLSWYLAFCSIYFIILSYSRIGYIKVNKLINAHNLTFYPNVSKSQSKYCHFDGNLELIVISLLYLIVTLSFQCFVTIYFRVKKLSTTLRRISSPTRSLSSTACARTPRLCCKHCQQQHHQKQAHGNKGIPRRNNLWPYFSCVPLISENLDMSYLHKIDIFHLKTLLITLTYTKPKSWSQSYVFNVQKSDFSVKLIFWCKQEHWTFGRKFCFYKCKFIRKYLFKILGLGPCLFLIYRKICKL